MHKISVSLISIYILTSLLIYGCENPLADHNGDHPDIVGFVIEQNAVEIIRFENNEFDYNTELWTSYFPEEHYENGEPVFTLSPEVIGEMESGMTPTVLLRWIDSDGEIVDLPEEEDEDGEWRLEWDWNKPNVLTAE